MNILATRWIELPDGVREVEPALPAASGPRVWRAG